MNKDASYVLDYNAYGGVITQLSEMCDYVNISLDASFWNKLRSAVSFRKSLSVTEILKKEQTIIKSLQKQFDAYKSSACVMKEDLVRYLMEISGYIKACSAEVVVLREQNGGLETQIVNIERGRDAETSEDAYLTYCAFQQASHNIALMTEAISDYVNQRNHVIVRSEILRVTIETAEKLSAKMRRIDPLLGFAIGYLDEIQKHKNIVTEFMACLGDTKDHLDRAGQDLTQGCYLTQEIITNFQFEPFNRNLRV